MLKKKQTDVTAQDAVNQIVEFELSKLRNIFHRELAEAHQTLWLNRIVFFILGCGWAWLWVGIGKYLGGL